MESSTKLYKPISFKLTGTLNSNQNESNHQVKKISRPKEDAINLEWETPEKIGAGFRNLGNTCYLNATLQSLLYTPPLANILKNRVHSTKCGNENHLFCSFCFMEQIQRSVYSKGRTPSSTDKIVRNVKLELTNTG